MRLNWTDQRVLKHIKFSLMTSGFEYKEFNQLHGLIAIGDVTQPTSIIRFGPARRGPT